MKVNCAHGQIQGIGAHWETWMLQQGGMTNHEALRCATYNPAWSLGLDSLVGSLEVGKLADLLVLDKNPLEDIRNTEGIRYVMVNGRIYAAETMNETGRIQKNRTKFHWAMGDASSAFDWHEQSEANTYETCSCGKH